MEEAAASRTTLSPLTSATRSASMGPFPARHAGHVQAHPDRQVGPQFVVEDEVERHHHSGRGFSGVDSLHPGEDRR